MGPNGAGKSTLLRLGAGVTQPTRGKVIRTRDARVFGYMPQASTAVRGLTVREQVAYSGWLQGQPRAAAWRSAEVALRSVGLHAQMSAPSSELSGGQLRRVALAEAVTAGSRSLILDEPTVGLDPAQRSRFRMLLDRVVDKTDLLLVSTHQVDDLEAQFDHVAVMYEGRIVLEDSVEGFMRFGRGSSPLVIAESAYANVLDTVAT